MEFIEIIAAGYFPIAMILACSVYTFLKFRSYICLFVLNGYNLVQTIFAPYHNVLSFIHSI